MKNALQDQLFKTGLIKKQKLDETLREKSKQRSGKAPAPESEVQIEARRLKTERVERDRALAAEQNAQAKRKELQLQIRQLIENHKIKHEGDQAYRFEHAGTIACIWVTLTIRTDLARGALVIAQHEPGYAVLPRVAVKAISERGGVIVLDHGASASPPPKPVAADDAYYQRFAVPDDLIW